MLEGETFGNLALKEGTREAHVLWAWTSNPQGLFAFFSGRSLGVGLSGPRVQKKQGRSTFFSQGDFCLARHSFTRVEQIQPHPSGSTSLMIKAPFIGKMFDGIFVVIHP